MNQFFCDNQGLITRLNHAAGPLQPFPWHFLHSDIDLEMQIVNTLRLLHLKLTYHHVKGHQDDDPDDTPLSREAELNVHCDTLATAALLVATPSSTVEFLQASKVVVTIEGTTITSKIHRSIRTLIGCRRQLTFFSRRYTWSKQQFDSVDWPLYRAATLQNSLNKRIFLLKWLNDLLPFQARMHKFDQSSLTGCPDGCPCESEDHAHLLHCPMTHRVALFEPMLVDVPTLGTTHKIDPNLGRVLTMLLAPY
jgi:hypothetical protein